MKKIFLVLAFFSMLFLGAMNVKAVVDSTTSLADCLKIVFDESYSKVDRIQCITNLVTEYNALLAEMKASEDVPSSAMVTGIAWCHTFVDNLQIGSTGEEVIALEDALQRNGIYPATQEFYATYDETLASYVSAFQEKYASEVLAPTYSHGTGMVRSRTIEKLNALYRCAPVLTDPAIAPVIEKPKTSVATPTGETSVQPTITVTSPNGGEVWRKGNAYTVTWTSQGLDPNLEANIALYNYSGTSNSAYSAISFSEIGPKIGDGRFIMVLGTSGSTNLAPLGDSYKIVVSVVQHSENPVIYPIGQSSNYFTIAPASTVTSAPSLTVTSPAGTESFNPGQTVNITWRSTFTTLPTRISIGLVDYTNPIGSAIFIRQGLAGNTTSYSWTIPANTALGSRYKVNVVYVDSFNEVSASSYSDSYFSITSATIAPPVIAPSITVTYPNGGEVWKVGDRVTATWLATGISGDMGIFLEKNGALCQMGATSASAGEYTFSLTSNSNCAITPGNYYVKIIKLNSGVIDYNIQDSSNLYVNVIDPAYNASITITSPVGGEKWQQGKSYGIYWRATNTNYVNITISDGINSTTIASNYYGISGAYNWAVPSNFAPGNYRITIQDAQYPDRISTTSNSISIIAPSSSQPAINITYPNGGEVFEQGQQIYVSWSSNLLRATDKINVSISGSNAMAYDLVRNLAGSATGYSWTIPTYVNAGNYKVNVTVYRDGVRLVDDVSNDYFTINAFGQSALNSRESQLASIADAIKRLVEEIKKGIIK